MKHPHGTGTPNPPDTLDPPPLPCPLCRGWTPIEAVYPGSPCGRAVIPAWYHLSPKSFSVSLLNILLWKSLGTGEKVCGAVKAR